MGGPRLLSEVLLPVDTIDASESAVEEREGGTSIAKSIGYWSTVPLKHTPSSGDFSLKTERPFSSLASDSYSSSTLGEGGHRGRTSRGDCISASCREIDILSESMRNYPYHGGSAIAKTQRIRHPSLARAWISVPPNSLRIRVRRTQSRANGTEL